MIRLLTIHFSQHIWIVFIYLFDYIQKRKFFYWKNLWILKCNSSGESKYIMLMMAPNSCARKGGEELERRRGMLTTEKWCNPAHPSGSIGGFSRMVSRVECANSCLVHSLARCRSGS